MRNLLTDPLAGLYPSAAAGAPPPERAERRASDFALRCPAAASSAVLAAGEVGWRALASVWPVGPAEARDVRLSACWTVHGSPGALVALADGSDGRTASLVSP